MLKHTPIYQQHLQSSAQFTDFAGWEMPLNYGSQLLEHRCVRASVGMFDVSHMCVIDVFGDDAYYYLRHLLANDIKKLNVIGRALYTCMLNHNGGIIDDMIVYRYGENEYRLVANAASREKVLTWMQKHIDRYDAFIDEKNNFAIIALQGPDSLNYLINTITNAAAKKNITQLKSYYCLQHDEMLIARTGYTGENGFEIMLEAEKSRSLWNILYKSGVKPCGLGARDSLRLEAGFNLYGSEMSEETTPLETNLAWTVSWNDPEREFIGKRALKMQLKNGVSHQLIGLLLKDRRVLRNNQKVYFMNGNRGEITSGGFSPTLGYSIALARAPINSGNEAAVDIRGKVIPIEIIKPPFIKHNIYGK